MYMNGSTTHAARRRVAHRKTSELIPITSSASISSRDPHRPDLRHQARADLRRHHVAERVRHDLAQVAPRREHARVRRRSDRAAEICTLDPALKAEDEGEPPDHEGGAKDEDARLAEHLPEEVEHPAGEDVADYPRRELCDVAERGDPTSGNRAHGNGLSRSSAKKRNQTVRTSRAAAADTVIAMSISRRWPARRRSLARSSLRLTRHAGGPRRRSAPRPSDS